MKPQDTRFIHDPAGIGPLISDHQTAVEPAHSNRQQQRSLPHYRPIDPLLAAKEAAAERGQALSSFWKDVKSGRVPPAIYISPRCPRWRLSEIVASVEACRAAPPKGA